MSTPSTLSAYTAAELAPLLDVTVRAAQIRATREGWPSRPRQGRGGGREYPVESLPEAVRLKVARHQMALASAAQPPAAAGPRLRRGLDEIPAVKRDQALAKFDLLQRYLEWVEHRGQGDKTACKNLFIDAYRAGAWPDLLADLGPKISWKSIERWKVQYRKEQTVTALVDTRGRGNAARAKVSEAHADILIRCVLQPNRRSVAGALRDAAALMTAADLEPLAARTAENWLKHWRERNFGTWVYTRAGKKAWNDACAFFIERDYSLIEVGDIAVADGHVLNFEIINPTTGKAKRMELCMWYDMASNCPMGWEILPTENTQCIAAAFRRACITLGKYPKVAYLDNGRAFRSQYFNGVDFRESRLGGLFGELGIQTLFAWPYHGQSKTVERFFGTMHDLEEQVPSYCGRDIEHKPPRMARGEAMHRKAWEAVGGRALTLEEAHYFVARWIDDYIQRPQKGHLKGKCPAEVFLAGRGPGVDEARLRHLMLSREYRKIDRGGVRLLGHRFYGPELHGRTHRALVRYDPQDLRAVYVYDAEDDNRLICIAPDVRAVHPAADILGDAEQQQELKDQLTLRKGQEKEASAVVRAVLQDALADHAKRLEAATPDKTTAAEPDIQPPSEAQKKRFEKAVQARLAAAAQRPAYTPPEQKHDILTELQKYEYLFGVSVRQGFDLRPADAEWMAAFEQTEQYRTIAKGRYDRLRDFYAKKEAAL
jgi:putative transposase